jgi:propanol-preferring alcohol dehydrogenase
MILRARASIEEHPLEEVELPDPEPGRREIRIQVRVCAICRTDLHTIEGDLPSGGLPIVPGHQVVGVVDALGPGCDRFRVGDRVGIAWLRRTCGECEFCLARQENLCPGSLYTGYHEHGGYAERAVVRESFAYPIPAAFTDEQAAPLLCAGIIGYRALNRSQGSRDEPPEPLHSAIIFAPAGEIVPDALRALRPGGTLALAGIHMSPVPELDYEKHLFHEKTLQSVEANTRRDGRELLKEAAAVPILPKVTRFGLSEANQALIQLSRDEIDGTGLLVLD